MLIISISPMQQVRLQKAKSQSETSIFSNAKIVKKPSILQEKYDITRIGVILKDAAKKILYEKLKSAEALIAKIIDESSLKHDDEISVLLADIQSRLDGSRVPQGKKYDYLELENIYVNLIVGVMDQDLLTPDDKISLLFAAIHKRLNNFDVYFEKLRKNELKGPFQP